MRQSSIDAMTAHAVEALSSEKADEARSLVRDMASRWPDEPALSLSFAIASAASQISDNFDPPAPEIGYRLSALAAADVFALQSMGYESPTARDLMHFWRRVDPYFLNL